MNNIVKNSRKYWNTFKKRNPEISTFCRQLKLVASDEKKYSQTRINPLVVTLPNKYRLAFSSWIIGMMDPIDEQSKRHACGLQFNV